MIILSIDLAKKTGWALGKAGDLPLSGSENLRPYGGSVYDDPGELVMLLSKLIDYRRPDLLVLEEPLEARARWQMSRRNPDQLYAESWTLKAQMMLFGAAHAWARVSRINVRRVAVATVRKHVCGQAHAGERSKTKQMVLDRMTALGLVEPGCKDTDRADALCLWRWAEDTIADVRSPLVLT